MNSGSSVIAYGYGWKEEFISNGFRKFFLTDENILKLDYMRVVQLYNFT